GRRGTSLAPEDDLAGHDAHADAGAAVAQPEFQGFRAHVAFAPGPVLRQAVADRAAGTGLRPDAGIHVAAQHELDVAADALDLEVRVAGQGRLHLHRPGDRADGAAGELDPVDDADLA